MSRAPRCAKCRDAATVRLVPTDPSTLAEPLSFRCAAHWRDEVNEQLARGERVRVERVDPRTSYGAAADTLEERRAERRGADDEDMRPALAVAIGGVS